MFIIQSLNCGLILTMLINLSFGDRSSDVKYLMEQIEQFEEKFPKVFNENNLQQQYKYAHKAGLFKVERINEKSIVEIFSKQLEDELRKKMEALKKTVAFAENVAKDYKWDHNITRSNVSYIPSKKLLPDDTRLVHNKLFKANVVMQESSVHIPTEIYDEDEIILNTIKWTLALNKEFIKHKDILRYQYFASNTGIVVQYPGMVWRKMEIDMYDVRRRPWFVQGASSPKDIMILIDTSGSMHGISITLTMHAVKRLIDTMGENDYIAVAQFPGYAKEKNYIKSPPILLMDQVNDSDWVPCFQSFVQATKRNKDKLFQQIDQIKALGIAVLEDALEFGIKQFHAFDQNRSQEHRGANCNRIILVLTDGGDEYDKQKIKSLINESELTANIRIFIYSIGEEIAPTDSLEGITCDYRGFFGHIRAIGAVNNIIEKFASVVHTHKIHDRNPLGDNEFRVVISNVVENGFLDPDDFSPKGLGLMTSLTMPVYNRSGNGTFLGLLGTDMTVDFMNHLVPRDKLGPNGYGFAINTNGYIIFHPELKVQRGWMRDPPNVDLIEVEFDSYDKSEIRKEIIDCAAGNDPCYGEKNVKSFIKVTDEIHTYEKIRKYAFHKVLLSTFGVAIVNPTFNKFYAHFNEEIKVVKLGQCNEINCSITIKLPSGIPSILTFSKNVYIYAENGLISQCKLYEQGVKESVDSSTVSFSTSTPLIHKTSSQLLPISTFGSAISASIAMLENLTISSSYNSELSNSTNILMTKKRGRFSEDLIKLLENMENSTTNKCPSYDSNRLIVDLVILESFVHTLNIADLVSIKSIVVAMISGITMVYPESETFVYDDLFPSSWSSAIFQRSFDMDKLIFSTSLHRPNSSDIIKHNDVLIFKAFSANISPNQSIPTAVLGMAITQGAIVNILNASEACVKERICYILEDGGFIVSVSDASYIHEVGYFFGEIHVAIMKTLLNNSVFLAIEEFDYQASCPKTNKSESSSASKRLKQMVTTISINILHILRSLIEDVFSMLKLSIYFLFFSFSHAQETTAAQNENESCIQKTYRYYLPQNDNKPLKVFQSCNICNFTIITQTLKNSNLIILTFDKNCTKTCQQMNLPPIHATPIKDPGPNICALSMNPNYRKRPKYKCYEFDRNEDFTRCLASKLYLSHFTKLITLIMLLKCL